MKNEYSLKEYLIVYFYTFIVLYIAAGKIKVGFIGLNILIMLYGSFYLNAFNTQYKNLLSWLFSFNLGLYISIYCRVPMDWLLISLNLIFELVFIGYIEIKHWRSKLGLWTIVSYGLFFGIIMFGINYSDKIIAIQFVKHDPYSIINSIRNKFISNLILANIPILILYCYRLTKKLV